MDRGSIHITLDSSLVFAGDTITGVISVIVKCANSGRFLMLTLTGVESTQWVTWTTRSNAQGQVEVVEAKHHASRGFVNQRQEVKDFADEEQLRGTFNVPFAITLPDHVESVFSFHQSLNKASAEVKYSLVATLEDGVGTCYITDATAFSVLKRCRVQSQALEGNSVVDLSTCCFWSRGRATAHVEVDRNVFGVGEEVHVFVTADNSQSALAVDRVSVSLSRQVRLRDREKQTLSCHDTVATTSLPCALEAGAAPQRYELSLSIPNHLALTPTCTGCLFECAYTMNVQVSMSSCCSGAPHFQRPVQVCLLQSPPPVCRAPPVSRAKSMKSKKSKKREVAGLD